MTLRKRLLAKTQNRLNRLSNLFVTGGWQQSTQLTLGGVDVLVFTCNNSKCLYTSRTMAQYCPMCGRYMGNFTAPISEDNTAEFYSLYDW